MTYRNGMGWLSKERKMSGDDITSRLTYTYRHWTVIRREGSRLSAVVPSYLERVDKVFQGDYLSYSGNAEQGRAEHEGRGSQEGKARFVHWELDV